MNLTSIMEMTCFSCQSVMDDENLFMIHKCYALYCTKCSASTTCSQCDKAMNDDSFVQIPSISKCFYHFDCESFSDGFCSCVGKNLCERHITQVHRDIVKMPCKPVYHDSIMKKPTCDSCELMKAKYKVKENNLQVCINCAAKLDDATLMEIMTESKEIHDTLEHETKATTCLLRSMEAEYSCLRSSLTDDRSRLDATLNPILRYFNEKLQKNQDTIDQMESKLNESIIKLERYNEKKDIISRIIEYLMKSNIDNLDDIMQQAYSWVKSLTNDVKSLNLTLPCNPIKIIGSIDDLSKPDTRLTIYIGHDEIHDSFSSHSNHGLTDDNSLTDYAESTTKRRRSGNTSDEITLDASFVSANSLNLNQGYDDTWIDKEYHELRITHVRDPFWIYIEKKEMKEQRTMILDICSKLKDDDLIDIEAVREGDVVIVKDHPSFRDPIKRAQVSFFNYARQKYKVKLLDFGNSIEIEKKQMFQCVHDILKYETTVFRAKLIGVKPVSGSFFLTTNKNNSKYFITRSLVPQNDTALVRRFTSDSDSFFCAINNDV
uniref:Tudor domain-containing protein n=1 Tax=Tetranychus urticae TaxID=32264 RepID=T1L652_TETUR